MTNRNRANFCVFLKGVRMNSEDGVELKKVEGEKTDISNLNQKKMNEMKKKKDGSKNVLRIN